MAEVKTIQPDNEIFCSVYRKDFIFWQEYDHRKKYIHDDYYRSTPKMAEKFLRIDTKPDFSKLEQYVEEVKELNKLRLRTLYSKEYCPKSSYKILRNFDTEKFSPKNDKFLIDGAVKFGVQCGKVMPPLPSARRVLAYSAYDDYRTPLSTYEDIHGRLGYDRVKKAADGGYWRMGPRYDHEKEMAEIKQIIRREGDINEREKEENRLEEELQKKQIEKEREEMIRKSLEKRNSRKRGTEVSSRFGPDPRKKSSYSGRSTMTSESAVQGSASNEEKRSEEQTVENPCSHTKEQHEAGLRKKMIMAMEKPRTQCSPTEQEHEKCKKKVKPIKITS